MSKKGLPIHIEKFYGIIGSNTDITPQVTAEIFENCGLGRAYLFPNTFYWLRSFGSFSGFVESRKLQAFVDKQNGQFIAVKWTDTDRFDEGYYKVLLDNIIEYKKLCK